MFAHGFSRVVERNPIAVLKKNHKDIPDRAECFSNPLAASPDNPLPRPVFHSLTKLVVNKKRELLPDLSPTSPCLFALPLCFGKDKSPPICPNIRCSNIKLLPFRMRWGRKLANTAKTFKGITHILRID